MQANLFTNHTDPAGFEEHLLASGWIREYAHAFPLPASQALLEQLRREIPWRQDRIRIAGRQIPVPRLQCWMGGAEYTYSGIRLKAVPWHPEVLGILRHVTALSGFVFNSVLLNYYRDGRDSVSWHADDEAELGPDPIIASVSFGAERPFELRSKSPRGRDRYRLWLRDGSVLIMGKGIQNQWLHQIPKVKGLQEPRINLTFRYLPDAPTVSDLCATHQDAVD